MRWDSAGRSTFKIKIRIKIKKKSKSKSKRKIRTGEDMPTRVRVGMAPDLYQSMADEQR